MIQLDLRLDLRSIVEQELLRSPTKEEAFVLNAIGSDIAINGPDYHTPSFARQYFRQWVRKMRDDTEFAKSHLKEFESVTPL